MSRADLQIILRRAALMLRNVSGVPLEPATEDALWSARPHGPTSFRSLDRAARMAGTNAYLPVRTIDEESETDGQRASQASSPKARWSGPAISQAAGPIELA